VWVVTTTGFMIPSLPLAWVFVTAPWQTSFVEAFGGLIWAGYNMANFNLLLEMTPDERRAEAVALYQTVVFLSAVAGPLLGGYLAGVLGFRAIFALSAAGRLLGVVVFVWLAVRPAPGRPGPVELNLSSD
jgi:MFS family permease